MKIVEPYFNLYNLSLIKASGLEISRPKGLYEHTGIVVGLCNRTKRIMVFHNHPDSGPALVSMDTFLNRKEFKFTKAPFDSIENVLYRSFRQIDLGLKYSADVYNCQDATSVSRTGKKCSRGRNNTKAAIAIAALILFGGGK
jgi:hypothetical protein